MAGWPLPVDGIHLWRASLDVTSESLVRLGATLSDAEQQRSARFRSGCDRSRYVAARGQLRMLLGRYLDVDPRQIAFTEGAHGKPCLAGDPVWLRFNLAHSEGIAVYAVARGREVGVDIERIRSDFPLDDVAGLYYSPRERADLARLSARDRMRAAFDCWTRKEAYLKGMGTGLSSPLDGFDVSVDPGVAVRLRRHQAGGPVGGRWSIYGFDAGPGYAAAVAVDGQPGDVPMAARPLRLLSSRRAAADSARTMREALRADDADATSATKADDESRPVEALLDA